MQELERELATVAEQRDAVTLRLGNTQERMIDAERQRDRLAAVLQRIRDGYGGQVASPNCCEDCDFLLPIDEALAAVKGGGDDRQPTKDETEDGSPKVGSPPRRRGRRER
jgi:hypothetical protein